MTVPQGRGFALSGWHQNCRGRGQTPLGAASKSNAEKYPRNTRKPQTNKLERLTGAVCGLLLARTVRSPRMKRLLSPAKESHATISGLKWSILKSKCRAAQYRDSVYLGGANSRVNDQYAGKGQSEECGNQCLGIESRVGNRAIRGAARSAMVQTIWVVRLSCIAFGASRAVIVSGNLISCIHLTR